MYTWSKGRPCAYCYASVICTVMLRPSRVLRGWRTAPVPAARLGDDVGLGDGDRPCRYGSMLPAERQLEIHRAWGEAMWAMIDAVQSRHT